MILRRLAAEGRAVNARPKSRTEQLSESVLGQHIALSVAAGMARTQLVCDPLKVYDAQHLTEMLDIAARALAKVTTLYVREAENAAPRPLTAEEQETATIRRGATVLAMKDGRIYSSATMRRGDLRQAIAILKSVGGADLPTLRAATPQPQAPSPADVRSALLSSVEEIGGLLRGPLVAARLERADRLALSIARRGPNGHIVNLAMRLMSALHESRGAEHLPEAAQRMLARLRAAILEAQEQKS